LHLIGNKAVKRIGGEIDPLRPIFGNYGDGRILFLRKENPDPDFKNFSRERACSSVSTAI
jgi:hypothetical protein